jgi:hypothetical protein
MHYAIAPGSVKRVIDADSKACADLIVIDSEKNSACGPAAHRVITSEYCEDLLFTYFNFEEPVCYPNPNEGQLTVSFNMPDTSIGSIKLYDMFGHEMQRIFDGNFNAGRNNYLIDLSAIAHYTGVYVIQISAQNKSFLKKLIYLSK